MPVAPVDEDGNTCACEHEVGRAPDRGEWAERDAVPQPECVYREPYSDFRLGVAATVPPHDGPGTVGRRPRSPAVHEVHSRLVCSGTAYPGCRWAVDTITRMQTPSTTPAVIARRPVAIDLFAGAGGLSLGLEQAGFDVLAAVEYDPIHAMTHAYNFPQTAFVCDDVSVLDPTRLVAAAEAGWELHHPDEQWDGEVDLVAGGPPCQGFSWIGKRRVDDARNDLIFHFFRLVNAVRPRYFLMENVPGIVAGQHRALVEDLIERFRGAGYDVSEPEILNAAQFGVPQDRRRFILVGRRSDVPGEFRYPAPTVTPARPVRSTLPPVGELPGGPTIADAIRDLPNLDSFAALSKSDKVRLTKAQHAKLTLAASTYARRLHGLDDDPNDLSHPRVWDPTLLTSSAQTQHTAVSISRFAATQQGQVETISRFLRLADDGLCNTLRAGTGGERGAYTSPRPIHPHHNRVLSVREAARVHSFPDWFRLHSTKWHGFRQIGNAVPPLLGRALGAAIVDALGLSPVRPVEPLNMPDERLLYLVMSEAIEVSNANRAALPSRRRRTRQELLAAMEG